MQPVADTEGRGSFARNESRSRERSAFNRIKHVSFLRSCVSPGVTKYRRECDVDIRYRSERSNIPGAAVRK